MDRMVVYGTIGECSIHSKAAISLFATKQITFYFIKR